MKKHLKKIGLAMLGSFSSFLLEAGITIFLTEILHLQSNTSYAIGLIIGLAALFYYFKHIVFQNKGRKPARMAKFYILYSTSYAINWVLVATLSPHINYIKAIAIISIILWPLNYLGNDIWVFKKQK